MARPPAPRQPWRTHEWSIDSAPPTLTTSASMPVAFPARLRQMIELITAPPGPRSATPPPSSPATLPWSVALTMRAALPNPISAMPPP